MGWIRELISKHLKGGRLRERYLNPRLTKEEGLECVHNYSKLTGQPVTEVSAVVMNELTKQGQSAVDILRAFGCLRDYRRQFPEFPFPASSQRL